MRHIGTAGVFLVATISLATGCSGSGDSAAPAPTVTVTADATPATQAPAAPSPAGSPQTTQPPTSDSGPEQVFEQYVDENGGRPSATPPDDGLFGVTLGAPVERALLVLGLEDERYATDPAGSSGSLARQWYRGPLGITVDSDGIDAVTAIAVTRDGAEPDDPWRVALPKGLLLGEATVEDVLSAFGSSPEVVDRGFEEGSFGYEFAYRGGPEGSEVATFVVLSEQDLGRLTADAVPLALRGELITVYQIGEY